MEKGITQTLSTSSGFFSQNTVLLKSCIHEYKRPLRGKYYRVFVIFWDHFIVEMSTDSMKQICSMHNTYTDPESYLYTKAADIFHAYSRRHERFPA
uniref:Uncharacterized protein n=1 Tax=Anguilla anguilla TaxID=7936 RepID=A0A0E9WSD9_ANGAN